MSIMHANRKLRTFTTGGAVAALAACASAPVVLNEFGNPPTHAPAPTTAAINAEDLKTRLYIFADDSMQGRQYGRAGNMKGTEYIARELQRLGVLPAGDNGTYFQEMPVVQRRFAATSVLSSDGRTLRWLDDWIATPGPKPREINGATVVFGGTMGDTANMISEAAANGKLVVMLPAAAGGGRGGRGGGGGGGGGRGGFGGVNAAAQRLAGAVGVATVNLDDMDRAARAFVNDDPAGVLVAPAKDRFPNPTEAQLAADRAGPPPAQIRLTRAGAEVLLGAKLEGLRPGATGGTVSGHLDYVETPVGRYARNVVGIIRGSDPKLAGTYVALGAHPDHVGYTRNPVDHDSLKLVLAARQAIQMKGGELHAATPEELAAIRINLDSVRKLRPPRPDSIRNGADDDGSGSMALLEIAEAVSAMKVKPKRSLLFVWNNGEEAGLLGSAWYTMHPTVPRDSIISQINIDMIGRGRREDIPGGGDDYLAVVGSNRLSSELGKEVVKVNLRQPAPFRLDYRFDTTTTWPGYNNIYGRSDHANYARFNIPIAFFFTGLHADYHQSTDEPQYIDYPHYARITQYIADLVVDLANRETRPALDHRP